MEFDTFKEEQAIIDQAEVFLADGQKQDCLPAYQTLLNEYKKLLKTSRRLVRMSDRSEQKLKITEDALSKANKRMEQELNVGREIQMSMLPSTFPPFPEHDEFSIYAQLHPAREVGGDLYDFFFTAENWLCFSVGDVSGKGVPAALFMTVTKAMVKSRASDDLSPASIITHANEELSTDNVSSMFITFFLCLLNIKTGEMLYTNAGHNPPYIKRRDGSIETLNKRHGPVMGAMEGIAYKEDKNRLYQGDMIFLFTDGVTEAMDEAENLFGEASLLDLLKSGDNQTPDELVNATFKAVKNFENGTPQSDDITVLALKYLKPLQESIIHSMDLILKNRLYEIDRMNNRFNEFAGKHAIPLKISRTMGMIFDELLNNIISYAFLDESEHEIEVKVELSGEDMVITLTDDGIPFNPFQKEAPDTKLSIEDREIGGLGILLVRQMMDKVSYQRKIDKNVISLVKTITH